ncbi:CHAD domain-containing protein [Paenibacillus rhizoplanae]
MTTEPQAMHRQLSKSRQWEQAMNKLYINFQDYSKDARKGFNDEDIHQARVNSRKLLTLLSILDPGHTATADLYDSFKQAQKKLGRVRDADVLIGSFEARRKAAKAAGDKKTAKLLKAVIGHQKDTRKASRKKLKKALPKLSGQALEALWTPFYRDRA